MEKFLVTGANGFVGSVLCEALLARDLSFVPCVRQPLSISSTWSAAFASGGLSGPVDWTSVLTGCSVVIHLAARVHMMREQAADPDAVYWAMNVDATMRLAEQATGAGRAPLHLRQQRKGEWRAHIGPAIPGG